MNAIHMVSVMTVWQVGNRSCGGRAIQFFLLYLVCCYEVISIHITDLDRSVFFRVPQQSLYDERILAVCKGKRKRFSFSYDSWLALVALPEVAFIFCIFYLMFHAYSCMLSVPMNIPFPLLVPPPSGRRPSQMSWRAFSNAFLTSSS